MKIKHRLTPLEDIERILEFDFVRATEAAALNSIDWLGRGQKELADQAACDAMRGMFDLVDICGEVVIGEGIKDNAPGIFKGEHLGRWIPGSPKFDLAIDPIDGTTNIAKGAPNSISCIAAASPAEGQKTSMQDIPSFYMMKLAYGPKVVAHMKLRGVNSLSVQNTVEETIIEVAHALHKRVQDVVVVVMDRPRHAKLIEEVRSVGAALRMIGDGDITAAMAPSLPESGIDLYLGVGGAPEAVLAAAGIKCLGGDLQATMWPRDNAERQELLDAGLTAVDFSRVFFADDLAHGRHIIFCATGISDSALLPGVQVRGTTVVTHSVLMRAKSRTVRFIKSHHDLTTKTIRLRSSGREHGLHPKAEKKLRREEASEAREKTDSAAQGDRAPDLTIAARAV
ncbi:MAG: class II fructose-bisphosphatase [Verrucomicrobia bacterium]|nr:class II fructose-bisphosphatase [Verrucomicrobiota bacterium]